GVGGEGDGVGAGSRVGVGGGRAGGGGAVAEVPGVGERVAVGVAHRRGDVDVQAGHRGAEVARGVGVDGRGVGDGEHAAVAVVGGERDRECSGRGVVVGGGCSGGGGAVAEVPGVGEPVAVGVAHRRGDV